MDLHSIPVVPAHNGAQGPVSQAKAEIIVMHSMECPPDDAHVTNWVRSLAATTGTDFFAHYYCGPTVTYQTAPLGRTVWHCGNGNSVRGVWTLGVEEAGYAAQTRQQWIDGGVLNQSGPLVAALIAAGHGAPRWLEISDLAIPGVRGVTSHNNMSHAFGGSDHTDPGPNYPHDLLLAASPAPAPALEDEEMPLVQHTDGHFESFSVVNGHLTVTWQSGGTHPWPSAPLNDPATYTKVLGATRGNDGNVVVLAATTGGNVSWYYDEKAHKWVGPAPA